MAEAATVPKRFDDPYWSQLAEGAESREKLPAGLLKAVLLHGERSNADQVSPVGARTPFQIMPATRNAFLDKYGVDAYLNPENAARVAALHLRESLDRNGGNPIIAIAEYNTSPGNVKAALVRANKEGDTSRFVDYLPRETRAYVPRTLAGWEGGGAGGGGDVSRGTDSQSSADSPEASFKRVQDRQAQPTAGAQVFNIYNAYRNGQMSPEDASSYEADVAKNPSLLPFGGKLLNAQPKQAAQGASLPPGVLEAYQGGKMLAEDRIELEKDVANGMWKLSDGIKLGRTEPRGVVGSVVEGITGSDRATDTTRNNPEWTNLPELQEFSLKNLKTSLGTLTAGPAEIAKIIKAQNPGVQVRQDEKGNYVIKSAVDGKDYPIPPGLKVSDIPRVLGAIAAFTPAGRARTIAGSAAANAGTQAAIEGTEALAGGDFNVAPIVATGGIGAAVPLAGRAVAAMRTPTAAVEQATLPAAAQVTPRDLAMTPGAGAPSADAAATVTGRQPFTLEPAATSVRNPAGLYDSPTGQPLAGGGTIRNPSRYIMDDLPARSPTEATLTGQTDEHIFPSTGAPVGRTVNVGELPVVGESSTPAAAAAPTREATPAATRTTTAATDFDPKQLAALVKTASSDGMGAVKAQEQIAAGARINPEAKAAAERLGIDIPADVLSDSTMLREAAGLTRAVSGSPASSAWRDTVEKAAQRADDVMAKLDGSRNIAAVSEDVKSSLSKFRTDLENSAKATSNKVDARIPRSKAMEMTNLEDTLRQVRRTNPNTFSAQEKALLNLIQEGKVTYGDLMRTKNLIGKALEGKESPYGNMVAGDLKRLYGSLAQDQLDNVERIGGTALRDQLRGANQLYAKKFALEKRIINAFGKEGDGSIATLLTNSIESGAKGNVAPLNKALKVIPEDMRKEAVVTAIMSAARARGGVAKGDFGFAEYTKLFRGLQDNAPIFWRIDSIVGHEGMSILKDLYTVSRRMTDARAMASAQGKINRVFQNEMGAESLISKIMRSVPGRAATIGASAAGGGPVGAMLAGAVTSAISGGKKSAVDAAGKLFTSAEFNKLLLETSSGAPADKTIKAVANSSPFVRFAREIGLPKEASAREQWLRTALSSETSQETQK